MTTSTSTRPRGASAVVLDPDALLAAARAKFGGTVHHLTHGPQPQMLIPVNRGEAAVVNGEGVGEIADESNEIEVYFDYGFQLTTVKLSVDEIALADTGERIDLADGIRVFGARLNANHRIWFRKYDQDNSPN